MVGGVWVDVGFGTSISRGEVMCARCMKMRLLGSAGGMRVIEREAGMGRGRMG